MYSPKIKEEFIPRLYKLAKKKEVPMTKLTNTLLEEALINAEHERGAEAFFRDFIGADESVAKNLAKRRK